MRDVRCLAVHHPLGPYHTAAVGLADRLMAETDAEDRQLPAPAADQWDRDARLRGRARPRRYDDGIGLEGPDVVDAHGIVPSDDRHSPKLAQILDEIVGE